MKNTFTKLMSLLLVVLMVLPTNLSKVSAAVGSTGTTSLSIKNCTVLAYSYNTAEQANAITSTSQFTKITSNPQTIEDYDNSRETCYTVFFVKADNGYVITGMGTNGNGDIYPIVKIDGSGNNTYCTTADWGNIARFPGLTNLARVAADAGYTAVFGYTRTTSHGDLGASGEIFGQEVTMTASAVCNDSNVIPGDNASFTVTLKASSVSSKISVGAVNLTSLSINGKAIDVSTITLTKVSEGTYTANVNYTVTEADYNSGKVQLDASATIRYIAAISANGVTIQSATDVSQSASATCSIAPKNGVKYTVNYAGNYSSRPASIMSIPKDEAEYYAGRTVNVVEAATADGTVVWDAANGGKWVFDGWYVNGTKTSSATMSKSGVEFVGTWTFTPVNYTVTFYDEDGTTVLAQDSYAYGATPTCTTPTKPSTAEYSYTFDKWTPSIVSVTGDAEYVASYTASPRPYTVTYKVDGVQVGEVETHNYGTAVTIREKYTKTGYTVSDWDRTENFSMPAENVVINATSTVNQYKVTYKVDGVQVGSVETYDYGTAVSIREKYTKEGYTVSDWSRTSGFNMPAEDVVISATTKINSYKVIYKVDGVQVGEIENYNYGTAVTIRAKYTMEGYTVSDWSRTSGFNMPAEDVVINATSTVNQYKVTYKVDGVQVGEVETYDYGTAVTIRAKYTKEGYTVSDWSRTSGFNMPAEDVVINATSTVNQYKVTYKVDGVQVGEVETYDYGTAVTIRAKYTKEGYTVSDWDRTAGFNMPAEDVVINATSTVNQYKVTYKVDGVQVGTVETYDYGTAVTIRAKYTKEGYTVSDWDRTAGFNMPAEDVVINATSTVNQYKVTYKVDGVQVGSVETYDYGTAVTIRAKYTKTGYTVSDWSITEGFNMPAKDVVITATTEINSYKLTITYVDEKDNTLAETYEQKYNYDDEYSIVSPVIEGYTANKLKVAGTMGIEDITVKVVYKTNPYSLTIHYVDEEGNTLAEDHKSEVNFKEDYSVDSPAIEGYTADQDKISGTMEAKDAEFTVVYSINSYELVIHYVDEEGNTLAEDHKSEVNFKEDYSVDSPAVEGYTADQDKISGTMEAKDAEFTVVYSINSYELVIHYVDEEGNTLAEDHKSEVDFNEEYSVDSPAVEGYTADQDKISGTMEAKDAEFTVVYTANTYTVTYMVNGVQVGKVEEYKYNEAVTIRAPYEKEGYTVSAWSITEDFNMPAEDVVIEATSSINSYTLTIKYVDEEGNELAESYTDTLNHGEEYDVVSPVIEGYVADTDEIVGTITADEVFEVVYTKDAPIIIPEPVVPNTGDYMTAAMTTMFTSGAALLATIFLKKKEENK